jgi:hypothetical protein
MLLKPYYAPNYAGLIYPSVIDRIPINPRLSAFLLLTLPTLEQTVRDYKRRAEHGNGIKYGQYWAFKQLEFAGVMKCLISSPSKIRNNS